MSLQKKTINCLLIVEGEKLELSTFEQIFKTTFEDCKIEKLINNVPIKNESIIASVNKETKKFVIVKPKHNVLADVLNDIQGEEDEVFPYYHFISSDYFDDEFMYIFYIFDIDYADENVITNGLKILNDASSCGLLLLSSPSIEANADLKNDKFDLPLNEHISTFYKPMIQKQIDKFGKHVETSEFIKNNAFTLLRHSLYRNRIVFNSDDLFDPLFDFTNNHKFMPYKNGMGYHYPAVVSFVYLIIAILFQVERDEHPFETLDSILKRFASCDANAMEICKASKYL